MAAKKSDSMSVDMNAGMQAAKRQTLSTRERAYQFIQQKIVTGQLPAGSPLSELALAKELGSSRTPVREAISQLASEGILEQTANRGTTVRQFTRQDIIELYELREALETYAVGKVARQKVSHSDHERLSGLVEEIQTLIEELTGRKKPMLDDAQMKRFMATDLAFHSLLLRLAGNQRIAKVVQDTNVLIRIFSIRRKCHDLKQLQQIYRFHHEILEAVFLGNGQAAISLLSQHIQVSQQERLKDFDHWERESSLNQVILPFINLTAPIAIDNNKRSRNRRS